MEEMNGMGEATLDGDHLTFELRYHYGDEYTFDCERSEVRFLIPAVRGAPSGFVPAINGADRIHT